MSKTLSPLETSCSQHHDYYMQPCLSPRGIQSGINKLTILNKYYCNKVWIRIGKQPVQQPFQPQLLLIHLSYCESSCRCAITCVEMLTTRTNDRVNNYCDQRWYTLVVGPVQCHSPFTFTCKNLVRFYSQTCCLYLICAQRQLFKTPYKSSKIGL